MEDVSESQLTLQGQPDYALFGVFDGHLGAFSARYVAKHLSAIVAENLSEGECSAEQALIRSFEVLDASLVARQEDSGTCAVVALVRRGGVDSMPEELTVACVGDSRVVLARKEGHAAQVLSTEHRPGAAAEQARITAAGGSVSAVPFSIGESVSSVDRINGGLAVARALGDSPYKQNAELPPSQQLVTATPDVVQHRIEHSMDEFLLLASDGVFDVMTTEETVTFVRRQLQLASKQCLRVLVCG